MGVGSTPTPKQTNGTGAEDDERAKNGLSHSALSKLIKDQLPIAITLGMSPQEYLEGEISLFWAYVRAGKLKRKQEDELAWAQGYYFNLAVADVLNQALSGKGKKPKPIYPQQPVFTSDKTTANRNFTGSQKRLRVTEGATAYEVAAATLRDRFRQLNNATNDALMQGK